MKNFIASLILLFSFVTIDNLSAQNWGWGNNGWNTYRPYNWGDQWRWNNVRNNNWWNAGWNYPYIQSNIWNGPQLYRCNASGVWGLVNLANALLYESIYVQQFRNNQWVYVPATVTYTQGQPQVVVQDDSQWEDPIYEPTQTSSYEWDSDIITEYPTDDGQQGVRIQTSEIPAFQDTGSVYIKDGIMMMPE